MKDNEKNRKNMVEANNFEVMDQYMKVIEKIIKHLGKDV